LESTVFYRAGVVQFGHLQSQSFDGRGRGDPPPIDIPTTPADLPGESTHQSTTTSSRCGAGRSGAIVSKLVDHLP
jgi:hypothetical protein